MSKMIMKSIVTSIVVCMFLITLSGCGSSSTSSEFEEGVAAAKRRDFQSAMAIWKPLAQQGEAASQFTVGYLYANGLGVATDYNEAKSWYERAGKQDHTGAQYNLAGMYFQGLGVTPDKRTAIHWLAKAAARGHEKAQNNLSLLYAKAAAASALPNDDFKAIRWLIRAANQGNANAQSNLGSRYLFGYGVVKNEPEAMAWFRLSAAQHQPHALNNLGYMYEHGLSVQSNLVAAYALYSISVAQDPSTQASKNLTLITPQLSAAQVSEAQGLIERMSGAGDLVRELDRYLGSAA